MIKGIGKSQQAVLDFIKTQDHPVDATEIGLALYDKTSSCASLDHTFWSKDQIRRQWAKKLLNLLVRRGYLQRTLVNQTKGYYELVSVDDK